MNSSLARRQATGSRRQQGPRRRRRSPLVLIPLIIFGTLAAAAVVLFVASVGVFAYYSQDLDDPAHMADQINPIGDSVVYARDGKTVLATFNSGEHRTPLKFDQISPALVDATTAVEDKTFWSNTGFDPLAIAAAAVDSIRGDTRGASTITQQLVRQRLLDPALVQDPSRRVERKIKEIIQSIRLTDAFPGEDGKDQIITAYLNQNFYGNNSYGVEAAAQGYFDKPAKDLTLAQAALLAGIPQSPVAYDLVRNAVDDGTGKLIVPDDTDIVLRRNFILTLMEDDASRCHLTCGKYTKADFEAARQEPVELVSVTDESTQWTAPTFVWYVRNELADKVCGEQPTCDELQRGGLKIVTTLDPRIQYIAQQWTKATGTMAHFPNPESQAKSLGIPYTSWLANLRGQNVWNAAASAIDYETGEIIAYVGSADYYASKKINKRFQPQFDVLSSGWRQPGSAFKPFNYVTGIDDGTMTASTMLMDVSTNFGGGYVPSDADNLERGPLRVRQALQFSLNIPAVRALQMNGINHVFDNAKAFGMNFQNNDKPTAGLSMTLGTLEVHPVDLAQSYATLANGGRNVGRTSILEVTGPDGSEVIPRKPEFPDGKKVVGQGAAAIVTDILAGNTDPRQNPYWGEWEVKSGGKHRPATLKTGTNNDARDLNAYGYIATPSDQERRDGQYALVIGTWAGNSDNSPVTSAGRTPLASLDVTAPLWSAIMTDVTNGVDRRPGLKKQPAWGIDNFQKPGNLVQATVDAFTGFKPSQYSKAQVNEWFIKGTQPGGDPYLNGMKVLQGSDGKVYQWHDGCPGEPVTKGVLDLSSADAGHDNLQRADDNWVSRAQKGAGVAGGMDPRHPTRTAYFYEPGYQPYGSTWGGNFAPTKDCNAAPSEAPSESPSMSPSESPSEGPTEAPTSEPTAEPTAAPTEPPAKTPKPTKHPKPTETPATEPPATATPPPSEPPATPKKTKKPKPTDAPPTEGLTGTPPP